MYDKNPTPSTTPTPKAFKMDFKIDGMWTKSCVSTTLTDPQQSQVNPARDIDPRLTIGKSLDVPQNTPFLGQSVVQKMNSVCPQPVKPPDVSIKDKNNQMLPIEVTIEQLQTMETNEDPIKQPIKAYQDLKTEIETNQDTLTEDLEKTSNNETTLDV